MSLTGVLENASAPDAASAKLGAQVLQRLEAEIVEAGWVRGARLGAEEELARRFGVSRAIMREAAAMAELNGMVESRRGKNGGLFVAASARYVAVSTLSHYFVLTGTESSQLNEIRFVVQQLVCTLATRHMDLRSAQRLREILGAFPENPRDTTRSARLALIELHRLAGLRALGLFDLALGESSLDQLLWAGATREEVADFSLKIWTSRRRQIEAIIAADPTVILREQHAITALYVDEHRRLTPPRAVSSVGPLAFHRDDLKPMKKPEVVARQIAQRIARTAAAPGDRIGSEVDIMRELEVSRGVVREAIRSLERHGIVAQERGFAGGLHVEVPRPDEAVRVARLYLSRELRGAQAAVQRVALSLQLTAAKFAARRAEARDAAFFDRVAQFRARIEGDVGDPLTRLAAFDVFLAELSGSRVLACFTRILALDVEFQVDGEGLDEAEMRTAQTTLLDALERGDIALARRCVLASRRASGVDVPQIGPF
jgi:DNA-binding FadR family transcriptional regulator